MEGTAGEDIQGTGLNSTDTLSSDLGDTLGTDSIIGTDGTDIITNTDENAGEGINDINSNG
jgi:hypothetical protein